MNTVANHSVATHAIDNSAIAGSNPMLDELHQAMLAEPVSWWPQTWGWAALAVLLLIAAGYVAWIRYRRWRALAYRRAALDELARIQQGELPLRLLPPLLKRVAVDSFGRRRVAALSGQPWLKFLDQQLGETLFQSELGDALLALAYAGAEPQNELQSRLLNGARYWVEQHHA